ncbi:MAG: acyl-ACP--UDP-N-acetylglucosamine O-acyltransferase [Methylococcaceae bacterium]|nr:acyl-ACP--UDP-N-acetylglucosamine O-acyltransferase [Methylococcaceae bacterium]MCI0666710.1 acyl-ACP--UDP-N-acetylglucosamine O-acyltransferase [Methylococcaceae bacterium]
MIHPTAVIDPKAELAEDVSVGPYSVIDAGVRIGAGTAIGPHVVIRGPGAIGKANRIYQFASVGEDPQDKKYRQEVTYLEIGDGNIIREYCTIHRGTKQDKGITRVGNDNLLMAYVHVAHDCVIGNNVVMANGASLAGHVYLDDFAILGGFTLVHQFSRIGQHSFSAMGSTISRDVPPYVMVGGRPTKPFGINSVGLERKGFSPETIREIRRAYKTLYKAGLRLEEATQVLETMTADTPEIACMVEFVQKSGRGILR